MAKRKYNDSYIKFEFTSLIDQGVEKGQCVVCYCVLGNESLRPSKLSHDLNTSHLELRETEFFKRLESNCKCQRLTELAAFNKLIRNLL